MFEPGDIYFSSFPKFVQRPETVDYNIDSLKVNPRPRPIVVLEQVDKNRIIAAPISSDGSGMNTIFPSFVPLKQENYPKTLTKDSYIKLNQIQTIDTKWLYGDPEPKLAGRLNDTDLDRTRYFSLYVTQTERAYAKWISEIVSKNVKIPRADIEAAVINEIGLPNRRTRKEPPGMQRGDIITSHFQPDSHQQSKERISGTHGAIVLVDGKYASAPRGQSIVVPMVENSKEFMHLSSAADVGITHEGKVYRALVSQIQPMNWDWMESQIGKVPQQQMLDLDRSVVNTLGLRNKVIEKSREMIEEHLKSRSKSR